MKGRLLVIPALAIGVAAGLTTGVGTAAAAGRAATTVTIVAEGTDMSGVVSSPKPLQCAANRQVVVFKQKGARGGGNDVRFASDTASLSAGAYRWSTGNTGTEGKFYAKVRRTAKCKADSSPSIRVSRNP